MSAVRSVYHRSQGTENLHCPPRPTDSKSIGSRLETCCRGIRKALAAVAVDAVVVADVLVDAQQLLCPAPVADWRAPDPHRPRNLPRYRLGDDP